MIENKNQWVIPPAHDNVRSTQRDGEIVLALHELAKLTDELAAASGIICQRLTPVLRPTPQCAPSSGKIEEVPYCTDMGRAIYEHLCGIRRSVANLNDTAQRCEL